MDSELKRRLIRHLEQAARDYRAKITAVMATDDHGPQASRTLRDVGAALADAEQLINQLRKETP